MPATTVEFLATHRSERLVVVAERLVARIQEANPAYRVDTVPSDDLWRSCHDNIARILELLAEAVRDGTLAPHDDDDPVYDAARATGSRRARQGLPLDDVLRSFRFGGQMIWQDLVERGVDALGADELREIGTRLWEVVDATSSQVAIAYHLHERILVRADEQQKAELWEGVLSGRAREPGFAHEAARLLDLPVGADFVVVAALGLDEARADERLAPHATAWTRRSGGVVGLVALRESDPAEALASLAEVARRQQVALGVSPAVSGLGAADDGYRQATLALRAQGVEAGVSSLDARLPEALLLSSPEVAQRLLVRWIHPLLRLPDAESAVLLDTLRSWVAAGGSATRTAAAVPCHRNTVVNRLRRVSELTGTPLLDEAPPVELDLALRAWRMDVMSGAPPTGV